jgi:hypothetical protein
VEVRVAACLISTAKRKSESSFIRTLWRKFLGCPPALRFIQKKFIYGYSLRLNKIIAKKARPKE